MSEERLCNIRIVFSGKKASNKVFNAEFGLTVGKNLHSVHERHKILLQSITEF